MWGNFLVYNNNYCMQLYEKNAIMFASRLVFSWRRSSEFLDLANLQATLKNRC